MAASMSRQFYRHWVKCWLLILLHEFQLVLYWSVVLRSEYIVFRNEPDITSLSSEDVDVPAITADRPREKLQTRKRSIL